MCEGVGSIALAGAVCRVMEGVSWRLMWFGLGVSEGQLRLTSGPAGQVLASIPWAAVWVSVRVNPTGGRWRAVGQFVLPLVMYDLTFFVLLRALHWIFDGGNPY